MTPPPETGHREDDVPEQERLVKTTLLFHPDTLEALDELAEQGGFGSRGRTIQALVDSMPPTIVALRRLHKTMAGFNPKSQSDVAALTSKLTMDILPLFQAFGRFVPAE